VSVLARIGVLLVALGAVLTLPLDRTEAATVNVDAATYWFCSSSYVGGTCPTTIAVGDTVQWTFIDSAGHTTTECGASCNTPTGTPLWDSGLRTSGTFSHTFMSPGVFKYQCQVHTSLMRGEVTVTGASVGGVAELPDVATSTATAPDGSGGILGLVAGVAMTAGIIVLVGAAWYARKRRAAQVE
jgi:plastocyanin